MLQQRLVWMLLVTCSFAEQLGSNIYESLEMAARRFGKEDKRKAVIALTDGRDTLMFNETQRLEQSRTSYGGR